MIAHTDIGRMIEVEGLCDSDGGRVDPYEVLEVEADASPREIKSAYRRLARQWHPDRNREPGAAERFKQIASAWTILGDPEQRRRHSIRQGRAAHGQFPEDFLNDLANAIDRAEHWIREVVLPHYAQYWRGGGAEMAARLWVDRAILAEPTSLEPSVWWRRRKVAALADAILVTVLLNPSQEATVVIRGRDFWEVAVMPWALWHGGIRDAKGLDEAVMQLLLARYAQLTGVGRIHQRPEEEDESFVATAREVDSRRVLERARKIGLWSAVAGLIGLMMMAGYNQW